MGPLSVFFIVWLGLTFFFAFMTTCTSVATTTAENTSPIDRTGFQINILHGTATIGQRFAAFVAAFLFGLKFPVSLGIAAIASVGWAIFN